eukprot:5830971-Prymnesium_polylepis.1
MPKWYDDPVFDGMEEYFDGKRFKGDDWRCMVKVKEASPGAKVFSVAGVTFRRAAIEKMTTRAALLVAEANNPYDSNAVRVEVGGEHVGYVLRGASIAPQAAEVVKFSLDPLHVWVAVKG